MLFSKIMGLSATFLGASEFSNFKTPLGQTENSIRNYISKLKQNPSEFQRDIRSHWTIENKLHRILDVGFKEDSSRKRNFNAAKNYSILLNNNAKFIEK